MNGRYREGEISHRDLVSLSPGDQLDLFVWFDNNNSINKNSINNNSINNNSINNNSIKDNSINNNSINENSLNKKQNKNLEDLPVFLFIVAVQPDDLEAARRACGRPDAAFCRIVKVTRFDVALTFAVDTGPGYGGDGEDEEDEAGRRPSLTPARALVGVKSAEASLQLSLARERGMGAGRPSPAFRTAGVMRLVALRVLAMVRVVHMFRLSLETDPVLEVSLAFWDCFTAVRDTGVASVSSAAKLHSFLWERSNPTFADFSFLAELPVDTVGQFPASDVAERIREAVQQVAALVPTSHRPMEWRDVGVPFDVVGVTFPRSRLDEIGEPPEGRRSTKKASEYVSVYHMKPSEIKGRKGGKKKKLRRDMTAAELEADARQSFARRTPLRRRPPHWCPTLRPGWAIPVDLEILGRHVNTDSRAEGAEEEGVREPPEVPPIASKPRSSSSSSSSSDSSSSSSSSSGSGSSSAHSGPKRPSIIPPGSNQSSERFVVTQRVFLHLTRDARTLRCFSLQLSGSAGAVATKAALASLAGLVRKKEHPRLVAKLARVQRQLGLLKARLLGRELRAAGLVVREEFSDVMGKGVLLVTSPNSLLERRAEMVGLPKVVAPRQETGTLIGGFLPALFLRGGPERSFLRNPPYTPYFVPAVPSDPLGVFNPAERVTLVLSSIESPPAKVNPALGVAIPATGGAGHDMDELVHEGVVDDWLMLHDRRRLGDLNRAFHLRGFAPEMIAGYFGSKLAMYFAFLRFYTLWGVIPALVGVVATLLAGSVLMNWVLGGPQEDHGVPVWHSLMIAYALFTSAATMLLMSLWARHAEWLAHLWGARFALEAATLSGERAARPAFVHGILSRFRKWRSRALLLKRSLTDGSRAKGALIRGNPEAHAAFADQALHASLERHGGSLYFFPATSTFRRQLVSFALCLGICAGLVAAVYFSFDVADVDMQHSHSWTRYVSTVVTGLVIPVLDQVYKRAADALTAWELHMTDQGHEASLIGKLVLFRFLNAYTSIILVAFVLEDLELVAERLVGILITGAIVNNVQESLVPWIRSRLAAAAARRKARRVQAELEAAAGAAAAAPAPTTSKARDLADGAPLLPAQAAKASRFEELWIAQAEAELVLVAYDTSAEAVDYLELVIQYGYTTFFAVAFPLSAGLALINNIVEMRVDGLKLITNYRRPRPATASGIGSWRIAFELMSLFAIASNMLIIGRTDDARIKDFIAGVCLSRPATEFPCGPTDFAWTLVLLEHILLAFKLLLTAIVPKSHTDITSDEHRSRWFRLAEDDASRLHTSKAKTTTGERREIKMRKP